MLFKDQLAGSKATCSFNKPCSLIYFSSTENTVPKSSLKSITFGTTKRRKRHLFNIPTKFYLFQIIFSTISPAPVYKLVQSCFWPADSVDL